MIRYFLLFLSLFTFTAAQAQLNNDPDHFKTDDGELVVHPIVHGSVILEWKGQKIFVDPYGDGNLYESKGDPDLILITHPHSDHLSPETLSSLNTQNATFIVPKAVFDALPEQYKDQTEIMANGENIDKMWLNIGAIPMYNLPEEGARHPKGWGNGYILTLGGKRVYLSGDTEGIPEMRSLEGIDIAFVCMNLPYTMDIDQAADAVLDFEPLIVYPYHHRGQDIEAFKKLVDVGEKNIEVRLKDWYPGR